MARHAKGWTLRRRTPGGVYLVRFTLHGRVVERSTGCRSRAEAEREAARIYAYAIANTPAPRARGAGGPLEEAVARWLVSLEATHDPGTLETWELYGRTHWLTRWRGVHELTAETLEAYRSDRLGSVSASTVRKELSALRIFLRWVGHPVMVPSVGKRTIGTAYEKPRRQTAPELSPEQIDALLDALPVRSTSRKVEGFPIRARFVVAYETSLRPSTLDRLETPKHYRRGASTMLISADIDKARFARELPLSVRARRELDTVCPESGLIFGAHDYRWHLERAAREALPADVAARFCGAHLRSARITHALERTGNLPGVQWMAGHKLLASTSVYAKPSLRAAFEVLRQLEPEKPGKRRRSR